MGAFARVRLLSKFKGTKAQGVGAAQLEQRTYTAVKGSACYLGLEGASVNLARGGACRRKKEPPSARSSRQKASQLLSGYVLISAQECAT